MSWGWYRREPSRTRPADGIRAQTQKGQFGKTWWAGKWLAALERLIDSSRLSRGRSYARRGQVVALEIAAGQVAARVQGSRPTPYKVSIAITPLAAADWEKVAAVMAGQAVFAAKLLAGEMPQDIEAAFAASQVSLFPDKQGDLTTTCSCPDWANPCKHVAAVYLLLGEQFDADPFLIFRLRGIGKDDLLEKVRRQRSALAPADAPAEAGQPAAEAAPTPEPPAPLEHDLERFWAPLDTLDDVRIETKRPPVHAVAVRRLGAPGFWQSNSDFVATFSTIYRDVAAASLRQALGEEDAPGQPTRRQGDKHVAKKK